jgi:hypothetical protein
MEAGIAAGLQPGASPRSALAQLVSYARERWETMQELARLHVGVSTASDAMSKKGLRGAARRRSSGPSPA